MTTGAIASVRLRRQGVHGRDVRAEMTTGAIASVRQSTPGRAVDGSQAEMTTGAIASVRQLGRATEAVKDYSLK